jgi:hypothetical protein
MDTALRLGRTFVARPVGGEVAAVHVHTSSEREGVAVGAVDGDRDVQHSPADGAVGVDPPKRAHQTGLWPQRRHFVGQHRAEG